MFLILSLVLVNAKICIYNIGNNVSFEWEVIEAKKMIDFYYKHPIFLMGEFGWGSVSFQSEAAGDARDGWIMINETEDGFSKTGSLMLDLDTNQGGNEDIYNSFIVDPKDGIVTNEWSRAFETEDDKDIAIIEGTTYSFKFIFGHTNKDGSLIDPSKNGLVMSADIRLSADCKQEKEKTETEKEKIQNFLMNSSQ